MVAMLVQDQIGMHCPEGKEDASRGAGEQKGLAEKLLRVRQSFEMFFPRLSLERLSS